MPFSRRAESRHQRVVPTELPDICRIFVDNSNIWIEGQKLAASGSLHLPKLIDAEQDQRFRLHMDNLVETLLNNRQMDHSICYGSQPAPSDTSRKSGNKYHLETKIFERSHGKEKQVDIAMAVDIAFLAAELDTGARYNAEIKKRKRQTVFIVVTGDCDLLPSIEGALDRGIRVELWAWSSNLSRKYIALEKQHSTLSVRHLDPFAEEISYLEYKSTWTTVDPAHAVVLKQKAGTTLPSDIEGSITEKLKDRRRLFYITELRSEPYHLAVEFPQVKNLDIMIHALRPHFEDAYDVTSWAERDSRTHNPRPGLQTWNSYAPLANGIARVRGNAARPTNQPTSQQHGITGATAPGGITLEGGRMRDTESPDDAGSWTIVSRSDPRKRHIADKRREKPCPNGTWCEKRGACGHYHNPKEQDSFRDNPGRNAQFKKTKKCTYQPCNQGRQCLYAHNEAEAMCLACRRCGHFTSDCPHNFTNNRYAR